MVGRVASVFAWVMLLTLSGWSNLSGQEFGDFGNFGRQFDQENQRLFLSVTWSGLGWRR